MYKLVSQIFLNIITPIWLLNNDMNSKTNMYISKYLLKNSNWLDVGCGLRPYENKFKFSKYTGIDIKVSGRSSLMKLPDKYYDGKNIPYDDDSFDGILCTQVLEHVENIDALLKECNRVLKIGGNFIITVPFTYREHEQPYDFRRFTSYGLKNAMEQNGFKMIESAKCLSGIETIATLLAVHLYNNFCIKNKFMLVLIGLVINLPLLLFSKFISNMIPDNGDLYCILISNSVKVSEY